METTILFAPLVGAILCGFGWRIFGEAAAMWIATGLLFLSAALSWVVFLTFDGVTEGIHILRWIESGSLSTDWAIRMDRLTAIMLIVITTVSSLVHLYSFGYMNHDPQWKDGETYKPRFFAYLSFFTFAMLMLVTSDNLVQMFFGWEGVGVASYLLIGFYYRKPSANAAAIKAFVVNRVGDFGFALGIFGLFFLTDSIRFDDIFAAVPAIAETQLTFLWGEWNAANLIAILVVCRRNGEVSAVDLAHLAARCDGRPNTGVGAHSCRNHGDGRCFSGVPDVALDGSCTTGHSLYHRAWGHNRVFCGDRGVGADRHQACDRLFDLFAAWLYVRCCRCWHVLSRHVSSVHPCVF